MSGRNLEGLLFVISRSSGSPRSERRCGPAAFPFAIRASWKGAGSGAHPDIDIGVPSGGRLRLIVRFGKYRDAPFPPESHPVTSEALRRRQCGPVRTFRDALAFRRAIWQTRRKSEVLGASNTSPDGPRGSRRLPETEAVGKASGRNPGQLVWRHVPSERRVKSDADRPSVRDLPRMPMRRVCIGLAHTALRSVDGFNVKGFGIKLVVRKSLHFLV